MFEDPLLLSENWLVNTMPLNMMGLCFVAAMLYRFGAKIEPKARKVDKYKSFAHEKRKHFTHYGTAE
jgi:hypothetical protein